MALGILPAVVYFTTPDACYTPCNTTCGNALEITAQVPVSNGCPSPQALLGSTSLSSSCPQNHGMRRLSHTEVGIFDISSAKGCFQLLFKPCAMDIKAETWCDRDERQDFTASR